MSWQPTPRTYRVEFSRDLRPDAGLHWKLIYSGDGHWCAADNHMHRYATEQRAEEVGRLWVSTGRTQTARTLAGEQKLEAA